MTARLVPFGSVPAAMVVVIAIAGAFLVGALTAADVKLGIGLLMGLCYAPLALLSLPVALALWVTTGFIENHPAVSVGPTAAGLVVLVAWFGTLGTRRAAIADLLSRRRLTYAAVAALLVWLSVSALWATDPGMTGSEMPVWIVAALVLLVVSSTVTSSKHLALVVGAFVAGAALSVALGVFSGGLSTSQTAIDTATSYEGRLTGGVGDPNELAAGLVPALVLGAALLAATRDAIFRWGMALVLLLIGVGLAATQSRGGLIAAAVALAAALLFYPRKRVPLAMLAVVAIAFSGWFVTSPSAFERISDFNGGGTGRTELWSVGWQLFKEEPLTGIGLNNFRAEAYRYVRQPGQLEYVDLIAERPRIVHNAYLQMLVEAGIIGFALFLAAIMGCLRAAWLAARRFELLGETRLAEVARAVLVASIGTLAASFFVSNGGDKRIWVLLALGPALLVMADRAAARGSVPQAAAQP